MKSYNKKSRKFKIHTVILIGLIAIFAIIALSVKSKADGTGNYPSPLNGDWIIDSETEVWNETIILNGNLSIENCRNLTFKNVTLIMNCSFKGQYYIEVKNNGKFDIYDNDNSNTTTNDASNITSYNETYVYNFYVRNNSKLNMKNSFLSNCGFWDKNNQGNWGLYINSNNVKIEYNNFSNNYGAICINSSSPIILNNTFWNNSCAIYLCSSNATIENNTIMASNYGIYCDFFSSPAILKNNIFYNTKGIYCNYYSNPKIYENNIIENELGILCNKYSSPLIIYNDILNNDYGINCTDKSKPNIKTNKISFNKNEAIYCNADSNATIEFNTILNNKKGIYCEHSSPKIENNGILNNEQAIYCKSGSPNILDNIISNNIYGISCWYSKPIISGNILINNSYGVDIPYNSKETILKISNTFVNEIDVKNCYFLEQKNKTIENRSFDFKYYTGSITAQGLITLYDCENFTILNSKLEKNENGIYIYYSSARIINNTLKGNENGLYCRYSYLEIINNKILENLHGISCFYSNPKISKNQFNNNNDAISCWYSNLELLNNTISENIYSIYLKNSNLLISNSSILNSFEYDFYLEKDSQLTALNTTFDKNKILIGEGCELTVKWLLNIKVVNNKGNEFPNVRVHISDNENGTFDKIYFTDSNGLVEWIECIEFIQNFLARKYFVPYTINVSKYWSWNKTKIILDKSKYLTTILEIKKNWDWIVKSKEVYWNETIILTGNLTIRDCGNLTFHNVTLLMNCSEDGEFGILVGSGGEFHILDYDKNPETKDDRSNITAVNTKFKFKFLVDNGAKFEMRNSELSFCGYASGDNGRAGLTIQTNNALIDNSSIFNNYYGICLYTFGGNNIIKNNIISQNDYGIYLWYSNNNQIINNTVANNSNGILLSSSSINNNVINSTIYNSSNYDFTLTLNSQLKVINTKFNQSKVYVSPDSRIIIKYYLHVKVENSFKIPIENANVRIVNKDGSEKFFKTNKDGFVKWIECTEYIQMGEGKEYFTPHTIITTKNASYNTIEVLINQSKTIILILEEVKDWVVQDTQIRKNETIILNGNLTIENGGILEFYNVTLLMNCRKEGMYHIEVRSGGGFYIYDNDENNVTKEDASIISAINEEYEYLFYVRKYSTLVMKNSEIHECGFGYNNEGLKIESDDVILDKNLISNNYCGIYVDSSNPLIINNTIESNSQGIYIVDYSNLEIINNTVANSENYGIRVEYGYAKILKNKIFENKNGIYSFFSNIHINSTKFLNNFENGISFEFSNSALINCKMQNSNIGINCYKSTLSIVNSSFQNINYDFNLIDDSKIESINTSFKNVNIQDKKSELINKWFLDIIICQNGIPANNTNVYIWDNENGTFLKSYFTNENGSIKGIILTEYIQNKFEKIYYTSHSIDARNGIYKNFTEINMNESKILTLFLKEQNDWIVRYEEIIVNKTIILTGNLIIEREGSLTFRNVTLIMNCSYDGEYGILVKERGKFYILDYDFNPKTEYDRSNITAFDDEFEYKFLVDSNAKFEMRNSDLSECGYISGTKANDIEGLTIKANNTIINNSNIYNNYIGISVDSDNNQFANNIISNNNIGIKLYNSSNNQITNNSVSKNNYGVYLEFFCNDNQIMNNSIFSNKIDGIYLSYSSNNIILNSTLINSDNYDLYLNSYSKITAINTTFSKDKVYLKDENSELIVKWYLSIKVNDSFENPIPNAIVNLKDNEKHTFNKTFYTDSEGWVKWIECTEYIQNGTTKTYFTPHTINISKSESHTETKVTIDKSKIIYITLDTIPPEIFNINVNTTDKTATITWETNEPSISKIIYGKRTSYNFTESNNYLVNFHKIKLKDLIPDTTYFFKIFSEDKSGNKNQSRDYTFKTKKETFPPEPIKNLKARDLKIGGVVELSWDESDAKDFHYYNIYQSFENASNINEMKLIKRIYSKNDTITNILDLTNGIKYYFAVTAVDINGNENGNVTCVSAIPTKKVEKKEIKVLELNFPKNAKVGEEIKITAKIFNSGDVTLSNLKIEFYFGDKIIGERYLLSLQQGEIAEISIYWKARKGNEKIKIKFIDIDKNLEIYKFISEDYLNVEEEKEISIGIAIFILIIGVGVANLLWKKLREGIKY